MLNTLTGSLDFFDSLCRDREQSALHKAAWYGRFDMCRKLLEAGASSTIIDYKASIASSNLFFCNVVTWGPMVRKLRSASTDWSPKIENVFSLKTPPLD